MKIVSYLLSPVFVLVFYIFLLIFHPMQWIALRLGGPKVHQKVVDCLNFFLVKSLLVLGIGVKVKQLYELPENTTLLFVSNHQSIFDVPPLIWHFRKHAPKFVSKKELGKGIPSVSFNLRHGGAALIDRKNGKQALVELIQFSKNVHQNKWSAVIFPEGTRSRNGEPRIFKSKGLQLLAKYNPEAYIVPMTINNSWKVFRYGKFPLGMGTPITITTHEPIKVNSIPFDELFAQTEATIKGAINPV